MDRSQVLELLGHYAVMFVIVFIVIGIVRMAVGYLGIWIEFGIIAVVVFSYRPIVRQLGVEPELWKRE